MEPQALAAVALATIIGLGSLLTAIFLYRSKRAKLPETAPQERELTLLRELETIAEVSTPRAKPSLPLDAFADLPTSANAQPRPRTTSFTSPNPSTSETLAAESWKDWASEPAAPAPDEDQR